MGKRKKILAIDDELTIRKLLENFLGKEYDITTKEDGMIAMDWIQQGNVPDIIICDINMPNMNGYEFYEVLAGDIQLSMIPFVFLSARNELEDIRK